MRSARPRVNSTRRSPSGNAWGDNPPALLRAKSNRRTALGHHAACICRSEDAGPRTPELRTKVLDFIRPIIPRVFRTFMGSHHEPTLHIIGLIP